MKILALEFSSSRRSAALVEDGRVLCRAGEELARAAGPISLMTEVLTQAGLDRHRVECVALGLGPGSYTGIRVSVAVAQGLELGLGAKLLGVSSIDSMVWRTWLEGRHGEIAVVVDAQRGELYAARYNVTPLGVELLRPLAILSQAKVRHWAEEDVVLFGPDLEGMDLPIQPLYPDAGMVGVLASGSTEFVPGRDLTPIYLRETRFTKAPPPRIVSSLHQPPEGTNPIRAGDPSLRRLAGDSSEIA